MDEQQQSKRPYPPAEFWRALLAFRNYAFIKLIQVLAAVIADDGCLTQGERTTLRNLAAHLDDLLQGANVKADEHAAPTE